MSTIAEWSSGRNAMLTSWLVWASAGLLLAVALWRWAKRLWRTWFYAGGPLVWPKPWQSLPDARVLSLDPDTAKLWYTRFEKSQVVGDPFKDMVVVEVTLTPGVDITVRVVGQSGHIYRVLVSGRVYCNCPDGCQPKGRILLDGSAYNYENGVNHCKHVFFVKLKVLRLPLWHPYLVRLAFRSWEVAYMAGVVDRRVTASKAIVEAVNGVEVVVAQPKRDEAVCCLCCEVLGDAPIDHCRVECKQWFHLACLADLKAHAQRNNEPVLCPYDRKPWVDARPQVRHVEQAGAMVPSVAHIRGRRPSSRSRSPAVRGRGRAGSRTR